MGKFSASSFTRDLNESIIDWMNCLPPINATYYNEIFTEFVNVFKHTLDNHVPF